jgi:hypothetical protein
MFLPVFVTVPEREAPSEEQKIKQASSDNERETS